MSRIAKRPTIVLLAGLCGMALAPNLSVAGWPLVPPHSRAFGKSFEEWNYLYVKWFEETYLAGQTPSNTVGRVRFLPGNHIPGTYEFDVKMRPGTPFVFPPFPVIGEIYDDPNVPPDNPADPFVDYIFDTTYIRVELDGRVLFDGFASDYCDFEYGPLYFDPAIVYATPLPRGPGLNATAALWTQGIGAVYRPLPVGRHTLLTISEGLLGNYSIKHKIRVSPH